MHGMILSDIVVTHVSCSIGSVGIVVIVELGSLGIGLLFYLSFKFLLDFDLLFYCFRVFNL